MFVKSSVLKDILFAVAQNEAHVEQLLSHSKLSLKEIEDQDLAIDWIMGQDVWRMVEEYTQDPNIGLTIGSQTPISSIGLLGMLAQSSPNIKQAWEHISEFYGLFTNMMHYGHERTEGEFRIYLHPAQEWQENYPETARHAVSQAAVATCRIFSALCRKRLTPTQVSFKFKAPKAFQQYEEYLGCPVHFEQPSNSLVFGDQVADYKIVSYASQVYQGLKRMCGEALENQQNEKQNMSNQVMRFVLENIDVGNCTLKETAWHLHVSERTLQRRLNEEGKSFISIRNETKMNLAKKLLQNGSHNISEIAQQLGYLETSSFRKMFLQTTGFSPKQYQLDLNK